MPENLQNPAQTLWQAQPVEGIKMSADVIRTRASKFERSIWRRNLRETIAALIAMGAFSYFIIVTRDLLFRISFGLLITGMTWIIFQLHRTAAPQSMPAAIGNSTCLEFFRSELERQRDVLSRVWRWYLAPLVPGFAMFTVAYAVAIPRPAAWAFIAVLDLVIAGLFFLIWWMNMRAAKSLQRSIDALSGAERTS